MSTDTSRSEQVVEDFKKRKLATSAYYKIRALLRGFDEERAFDRRMARIGLIIVVAVIAIATFYFVSMRSVTLS